MIIIAAPNALALEVAGPAEVFSMANRHLAETRRKAAPRYEVEIRSAGQHDIIRSPSGVLLKTAGSFANVQGRIDTLLVADGMRPWQGASRTGFLEWLRKESSAVRRLASVCTGAFLLAEAGLLEGRRVTTHWAYTEELRRRYPNVKLQPNAIYVRDRELSTSAGVTAGLDLTLAFVEEDLGTEVALYVSRALVLFLRRPGGHGQFSTSLAFQGKTRLPLREMPIYILEHLDENLSVEILASRMRMSTRTFSRVFREELGQSPGKFVDHLRLETAKRLLEESERSVEEIAIACGFQNKTTLARAYRKRYGHTPASTRMRNA